MDVGVAVEQSNMDQSIGVAKDLQISVMSFLSAIKTSQFNSVKDHTESNKAPPQHKVWQY